MIFTGERQPRGAITWFWANVDHDTVIKDDLKPEFRKVHTDRVTPIKAGDPLGYLGIYQLPDDDGNAYSRQQMHFEIFTSDSEMVDYLLNNPLGLTRGRQYLRLTKGTVLMLPGTEAQTTESYTLRFDHAVPLEELKTEELSGKTGYRIDVEGRSGYIEKTDDLEIVNQHDGAKLGFQIVREDDPNHDGFLDPELISGVFLEIYKAIDADGNRRLSVEELVAAKDNPVLKEIWSKLIAHHPTEWRNHNGTARRLSEMLTDPDIPPEDQEYCRNLLPQELVRMQMLSFWDRLNPSLPESSYYFHPVRFVECFSLKPGLITVELIEKVTGKTGPWFLGEGRHSAEYHQDYDQHCSNIKGFDKKLFVEMLNAALERYEIIDPYYQAHFLAQIFHESDHFNTTLEYASGRGYDPGRHRDAIVMGNTEVGDGPKYRGKGLIQLTWKINYRKYGNHTGKDLITNPWIVASSMYHAIDASCWYWRRNGTIHRLYNARGDINVIIENNRDNVTMVTLAVNGGDNGLDERKTLYEKIKKELSLNPGVR